MTAITLTQYQATERELATGQARTAFRVHATVYAVVISILTLVNLLVVPQFYWFEFPMLGWGFGLFMHYTFGYRKATEQITRRHELVTRTASQS